MRGTCRACRGSAGRVVLDLGEQPACDAFPRSEDPGPDPTYPLQMWLCSLCGLAQLVSDPTLPAEPRGREPAALVAQAEEAVARVGTAGLLRAGGSCAEYGSPHGGSWLGLLRRRGLAPVGGDTRADVVVDCFGLMHAPDQRAALAERAAKVADGGVLLLQYHSLETIVRRKQWNALRHGHFAYYSAAALTAMLRREGFSLHRAWHFDLYGGTVLVAAGRDADGWRGHDSSVTALLAQEQATGVGDPSVVAGLQQQVASSSARLHDWLYAARETGRKVLGYGAASRAVSLLVRGGVDASLLPAIVDASPAKHGLRMPGTDIPVVGPDELEAREPDVVLLLLPDLMAETRASYPALEGRGGRWMDVEEVTAVFEHARS